VTLPFSIICKTPDRKSLAYGLKVRVSHPVNNKSPDHFVYKVIPLEVVVELAVIKLLAKALSGIKNENKIAKNTEVINFTYLLTLITFTPQSYMHS
jgi:hypothetical protein